MVLVVSLGGFSLSAKGATGKAAAREHYETATRLYDIREYDKALLEYKAAYLAEPAPAFLFNIGQCYRKLGQNDEALHFFQQYLKKTPPDDPNRPQGEARIRDIEADAKLKAEPAHAGPATSTPKPASDLVTPAPAPAPVSPAELSPAPTPEVAVPAPVPVIPVAAAPAAPPAPAPPPVAAWDEKAATASPATEARNSGRGLRIAGIACGVAGLASVGTAVYFYTRAVSLSDKVSNSPVPNPSDHQAGKDAETMQWVFYGVGAAALVAGSVLYFLGASSAAANQTATSVTPMVGPGVAGLSARGTF